MLMLIAWLYAGIELRGNFMIDWQHSRVAAFVGERMSVADRAKDFHEKGNRIGNVLIGLHAAAAPFDNAALETTDCGARLRVIIEPAPCRTRSPP